MLETGMRFLFFQAAARVSGSKDPLPIPIGFAARPRSRASYPIGVARSRPRMSESQSIESSRRPCARPPLCSHGDIRTENLPSNVTGPKDLRSVTKIPQDDLEQSFVCARRRFYHPTFRPNRRGMAPDYLSPRPVEWFKCDR
jgi:hypothetical protein